MLATDAQVREFAAFIAARTNAIAAGEVPAAALHELTEALQEDAQVLRTITDPLLDTRPDHAAKVIARRMGADGA